MIVIKREMYMKRIRPFIGTELIKVMTGIRRCGKSVMLELIKEELVESGISSAQFISINFEDLNFSHLQTAKSLHDEITKRAAEINGKVYLFFDEIQEVKDWEKCINSLRVSLDCDIYITGSNAKLLSGELSTYLGGRFVEFVIYPFSFAEFLELYRPIAPDGQSGGSWTKRNAFRSIYYPAVCRTLPTSATRMLLPSSTFMTCSTLSSSRTL